MKRPLRMCLWPVLVLLAMLSLEGCSQRELCYDHSHVSPVIVEFDWSKAPDATPETMVIWFFSTVSNEKYRFELTGAGTGVRSQFDGRIKVRPGTYRVLCHNGSTDNNSEDGNSFDQYRITTDGSAILAPMNRGDDAPLPDDVLNQSVRMQPSTVYAHTLDETVTIEPAASTEKHIRFTPEEATAVYDVIITGVQNLEASTEASAIITGLAEAWHTGTSKPSGEEVIIPFRLNHCGSDCLRGSLVTFGDAAPHDIRHYLRVYTSVKYYYDFDVTDAVHNAADSKHIEIRVNGMKLPPSGGGMSPGVDDWGETHEEVLPM